MAQTYLLDTNILLCALIAPRRLNNDVKELLRNAENTIYFSAASIWEIAIKSSLNKTDFNFSADNIHTLALETGFTELAIQSVQTYAVTNMAWHHRDPFDRLLIAQALALPAYLLTSDAQLKPYSELVKFVELEAS